MQNVTVSFLNGSLVLSFFKKDCPQYRLVQNGSEGVWHRRVQVGQWNVTPAASVPTQIKADVLVVLQVINGSSDMLLNTWE